MGLLGEKTEEDLVTYKVSGYPIRSRTDLV